MVNVKHFCPFERIIYIFKKAGVASNAIGVEIDFGSFGSRYYDLTTKEGKLVYFKGGFLEEQRTAFLRMPTVKGVSRFFFEGANITEKAFTVEHCLHTDIKVVKEFNGLIPDRDRIGAEPSFHSEALEIPKNSVVRRRATIEKVDLLKPYYNYVVARAEESHILIYGPALLDSYFVYGEVDTALGPVPLYKKEINDVIETHTTASFAGGNKESNFDPGKEAASRRLLECDIAGFIWPVNLLQKPTTTFGATIDYESYFKLIKICCFLEKIYFGKADGEFDKAALEDLVAPIMVKTEDGRFRVKLEKIGSYYRLPSAVSDFYYNYVEESSLLKVLFSNVFYSDEGVYFLHGGKRGFVISDASNMACFALALANYLSIMGDGSLCSVFGAIDALLSSGGLVLTKPKNFDGYILEGRSNLVWNGEPFSIEDAIAKTTFTGSVSRVTEIPMSYTGFAVVGLDDSKNVSHGSPDHYIVCYICDGQMITVYDPYFRSTYAKLGVDIAPYFNSTPKTDRVIYKISGHSVGHFGSTTLDLAQRAIT